MDGLSAAVSIVALLQLTGIVIGYLKNVDDAPKECQQCMLEASNIEPLLKDLLCRVVQGQTGDPWFTAVRALDVKDGPLDQYKQALEQLRSKVEIQDGIQKFKTQLLWKFRREEIGSILARMERLKSLVSIALENDHFKLATAIKEDTSTLTTTVVTQQHRTVMQWLSPADFPSQQYDIISRRQEGTGKWFLDSAEFKSWLEGRDKTLFCPGIPGAGKTMMAAIAVDHLCQIAPSKNIGVAYVYCSYKSQSDQSESALLAAILKQLLQSRPSMAEPVLEMHKIHSTKRTRPSINELFTVLQSACNKYSRVHIVVDALDECTNQDDQRDRLLARLRELQHGSDIQLMVTARFIPDIEQQFRSASKLEVRASDEDVRLYVAGQMYRLPKCIQYDDELKSLVQGKVVIAVDGMFLLARLYVDSLLDKRTKKKAMATLNNLVKGSASLEEAYRDAIKRIDGQLPEDRKLARHALSWMTYAQRLLTTQELCHALAVQPGCTELDEDDIPDIDDIISACAGLVTVDEKSKIVRLVHYTTQDYFERICSEWNPTGRQELASTCLTYLTFDTFRSGSCDSDENFEARMDENIFLDYAARYWAEHVRSVEAIVPELALAFLQDDAAVSCAAQIISVLARGIKYRGYSQHFPHATTGLHLSAKFGLISVSRLLLMTVRQDSSLGVDSKDTYGQTPLSLAAGGGHEAVVKLLVDTGKVDVNSKDPRGRTPLSCATEARHEAVVKLLVDTGKVDVNSKDTDGQTPLLWAAEDGNEAVVKLLVDTGKADVNSKDTDGRTPLWWAVEGGHQAVVKLLVDTGKVDVDSKDTLGQTPLFSAARRGDEAMVKLLVDTGKVDVNSKDKYGRTPLFWADGHEAVVKLLAQEH